MTIVYACLCMCICMCICMCTRMSCVCASMKDKPGLNNFFGASLAEFPNVKFPLICSFSLSPLRPWVLVPNPCHWHPNIRWRVQVDQTLVDSHLPSVKGVCTWPKRCICSTLEHGAKENTTSIRRAIHQNECNAATPSNPKYHLPSMKQFPSNKTSRLQSRTMPNPAQPSISTPNRDLLRKETYAPWAAKSWWGGLKEPPIRAGFSSTFFRSNSGKEKSMVKP